MRALILFVLAAFTLYGGYWFVGSSALERGATSALDQMVAEGRAGYGSLSVAGFPSRFDLTVNEPRLTDPASGLGWSAPFVQLFALSYRPNHLIAVWPHEQEISLPDQKLALTSEDMRASAVFTPGLALELDRAVLTADALRVTSSLGWAAGLRTMLLALDRHETRPLAYQARVNAEEIAPFGGSEAALPSGLPAMISRLTLDGVAELDRPLSRAALAEGAVPRLMGLTLRSGALVWGSMTVSASGAVDFDAEGVPEGRITIHAENWREMLRLAVEAGVLQPDLAPTIEKALTAMSGAAEPPEVLDLPLVFAGGLMSLGPLPIGPAPALYRQ